MQNRLTWADGKLFCSAAKEDEQNEYAAGQRQAH
jgi:hypothetical protein